jgi:hypothetical protein
MPTVLWISNDFLNKQRLISLNSNNRLIFLMNGCRRCKCEVYTFLGCYAAPIVEDQASKSSLYSYLNTM